MFTRTLALQLALGFLTVLTGCADLMDPNYSGNRGGYSDPYSRYDDDYYDRREDRYEYERDRAREERRKLERERERLEDERRRYEREQENNSRRPEPTPVPRVERCPSGFSPSEQKCSPEERRRGCKDMRLPGGLGCVRR